MKYTYFFYDHETGLTKIGRSANPSQRFYKFGGKGKLSIIALIEGDCEMEMHKKYSSKREHGEWFRLSGDQLRYERSQNPCSSLPGCAHTTLSNRIRKSVAIDIKLADRIQAEADANNVTFSLLVENRIKEVMEKAKKSPSKP